MFCICPPFMVYIMDCLWVAVAGESGGYHRSAERNTMCAPSRRTFLLALRFPQVIHAALIPTVMALSWGSAAIARPPHASAFGLPDSTALQLPVHSTEPWVVEGVVGGVNRLVLGLGLSVHSGPFLLKMKSL
ncbi:hypothetical protein CgunFtcFv8_024879 [Champsocephalus gunnari]|uniref:Uncharacterized protein n=1 Tax=Champsocephalus gunnari TaxID=52237 RepID=A0AAN8DHI5_CHAGU|nr:hypothetical protein CgunFtcFv8_024879 [Champsocephalus gunnari]